MDPITLALIGAGLSGGGSWLNSSAMDTVNNARNGVIQAERGRQQGFDAEAKTINDGSLARYDNFGDQQAAKAKELSDYFKTPVITPTTPHAIAAMPPVSSDLINREVGAKSDIAKAYVDHQGDTLGNLRSFGDLFGGIQRDQSLDAQKVGQIGGFKKGSSGVEAIELDNANRAGNATKTWADIASGLGKVALTAGLGGAMAPLGAVGADGAILGAAGPTSIGGAPLVGQAATLPAGVFASGASPFLNYGRA